MVTIRQCAVLVNGQGFPRLLLPYGDHPVLAWLLREFIRFGVDEFVLLAGQQSTPVEARIAELSASLPRQVRLVMSREPAGAGTGGAVLHSGRYLDDRFLLCNGTRLFDCNLARLLSTAGVDAVEWVMPRDGDMIRTGIYRFSLSLLDELSPVCSLEADILPRLASRGALRGIGIDGCIWDVGAANDHVQVQHEIPRVLCRRALFLDRDGVVNVDHGYVGSRDRFEWMPGAREAIRTATDAGWHVFVVTNQSGVARGLYDEAAVIALHAWMADEARRAGGTVDDIRYCPFHPDGEVPAYRRVSDWRKPEPGMLLDLMRAWQLDAARCVVVGDQESDMAAAAAAGIKGFRFSGGNLLDFIRPIVGG